MTLLIRVDSLEGRSRRIGPTDLPSPPKRTPGDCWLVLAHIYAFLCYPSTWIPQSRY
jgi:hypothetical protein